MDCTANTICNKDLHFPFLLIKMLYVVAKYNFAVNYVNYFSSPNMTVQVQRTLKGHKDSKPYNKKA